MILNKINIKKIVLIGLFVLLYILTGCEKKYKFVSIDENISNQIPVDLQNRYKQYWEAMAHSDLETTFTYELPYLQYLKPLPNYIKFKGNAKRDYKVKAVYVKKESDDIITIVNEFDLEYKKTEQSDKWIKINGNWYHYYYPKLLPPL